MDALISCLVVWSKSRGLRLDMDFAVGVGFLIVLTNSRVMERFIGLAGLLVSLVRAEANSQRPKKSLLAFNSERRHLCL